MSTLGFDLRHKNGFDISRVSSVAHCVISKWTDDIWDTYVFSNRPVRVEEQVHLKLRFNTAGKGFGCVTVCFTNEFPVSGTWRTRQLWNSPQSCRTRSVYIDRKKKHAHIKCHINSIGQVVSKLNDGDEQKSIRTVNISSKIWMVVWADGGTDNSITAELVKPAVLRQTIDVSSIVPQTSALTAPAAGLAVAPTEKNTANESLESQDNTVESARMNTNMVLSADMTDACSDSTGDVNNNCAYFSRILENLLRQVPNADRTKCMIEILKVTEEFKEIKQ